MNWFEKEKERSYHEISQLFPLMQGDEFEQLKADIAANGLREAIWLHTDGSIIDGRNRHRACIETRVEPHFKTWINNGSLVSFVISMNLHRRHLTSSQRAVIALDVLPMLEKEARERQGKQSHFSHVKEEIPEDEKGQARDQVALIFQTNPRYIQDAKKLECEAPELLEQVRIGNKTIPRAKRELVKRQKKESLLRVAAKAMPLDSVQLICGDFAQVGPTLKPGTFDAIITDPPYPEEYLYLYKLLAEQAAMLLKPGGSLLAMAGQSYLPEVYASMSGYLNYHWTFCYVTIGGQSPVAISNYKRVNTFWKPILWFVKGKYTGRQVGDVIKSDKNDKRYHEWGQSEYGMAELVERLTRPGDLILDPFLGGGTTAIVCHKLGREFVGIDIKQQNIDLTKGRLYESS